MLPGNKPVGRTPICSAKELARVDSVWCPGPVPYRYWQDPRHRRDYLLWLGRKLRFRWIEDYYKLTHEDLKHNYGAGLAVTYWRASAVEGVKECFPEYVWEAWRFERAPMRFWKARENRLRYMRWLAERLGYRKPEDWYASVREDFTRNFGGECVKFYRGSPALAAMDLYPNFPWEEWKFLRVPRGFWYKLENRKRYLQWLGKKLGYKRLEDWYRVRGADFAHNYAGGLLMMYGSAVDLLRDCFPELDWGRQSVGRHRRAADRPVRLPVPLKNRPWRIHRTRLTVKQVLKWADAYHERTGKWPKARSAEVDGAPDESWTAIDCALRDGRRGLAGGSSLPRLLAKHRGVRNNRGRPRLSVEQVLRWADRHCRRTGKWPNPRTGPVQGVAHETWCGINVALCYGYRGLPADTSLARLLAKHREVRPRRRKS